jgi:hypothetical protein
MKLITLIFFLTVSATSYGLSCVTTKQPLKAVFDDLDDDSFMDKLKELPTNEIDDESLCSVQLLLDYVEQSLFVMFTDDSEDNNLEDEMIQLSTLVMRSSTDSGDFRVLNLLAYACSEDGCEIEFISEHVSWLRTSDFIELKKKIGPLLIGDGNNTGEWFIIINEKRRVFFSGAYINSFDVYVHRKICALRACMKEKLIRTSVSLGKLIISRLSLTENPEYLLFDI